MFLEYVIDFVRWVYAHPFTEADDYCSSERPDLKLRFLLVNTVTVGWQKKRTRNKRSMVNAGPGYHSVRTCFRSPCRRLGLKLSFAGQVLGVPGEDLNYEETVVYNNDAIRPAFLIVYGDAPPVPPKPIATRVAVRKLFTTPLVS